MLLLGDELIRDTGIAVFELVKNAYDADASECKVILRNVEKESPPAEIIVEDNGSGMSASTVRNVWLQPGTENRKEQRAQGIKTTGFHRLPLGEKGVGRFAVHKLGKKICLTSRAAGQKEVHLEIDWKDFEKAEYLSDVMVDIRERKPEVFTGDKTGTRIEIRELRDMPWTKRRARWLFRSVMSICSPFAGPRNFRASVKIEPESDWLEGLLKPKEVLDEVLFKFAGTIQGASLDYRYEFIPRYKLEGVEGRAVRKKEKIKWFVEDPDTGKKQLIDVDLDEHAIGPVTLNFYVFDLEPLVLKLAAQDPVGLKAYLNSNGGVRVYRDGIRVYDFGEPGNDWLDLGGRRVNVPARRIGNNQIIGEVSLDLSLSADLVEKTNREGFVESAAYQAFRNAVQFAVKQAEVERNIDKERIHKIYARTRRKEPVLEDLSQLRAAIEKHDMEKPLMRYVDRIEAQYRDVLDRLLVAAGSGLNLAAVMHEVEKGIGALYAAISRGDSQERLVELAKRLSDMVDGLNWLTRKSGKSAVSAGTLIRQAILNSEFRFRGHAIRICNGIEDCQDPDFEVKCSRRLIMAALSNLIDNSIYWLDVKNPQKKLLYLGTTYELNGLPAIIVADNGPGFTDPPEYLVQPFITRKPDGMGLGLHIADEIMKTQGGRLLFPERTEITLPKSYDGAIVALEFSGERNE
jgi:signal transduction histidine kinase